MLKDKKFYPWMVVGMLVVVSLLNYLDRQMLATMRPFIMVDIKELESITNFGRLMAIFLWIYAIMSPISGMIADRLNRKWADCHQPVRVVYCHSNDGIRT